MSGERRDFISQDVLYELRGQAWDISWNFLSTSPTGARTIITTLHLEMFVIGSEVFRASGYLDRDYDEEKT